MAKINRAVHLDPDDLADLKGISKVQRRSVAAIMRYIIQQYLKRRRRSVKA